MSSRAAGKLKRLLAVLFWAALWQAAAMLIGKPLLLPAPVDVLRRLFELVQTVSFWQSVGVSLLRISTGIAAATAAGVALAVLTCRRSALEALFSPLLTVIKTTPVASFAVLVLIWVKRDLVPVLISALTVLPIIWANVTEGIKGIDPKLLEMAQVFRLPRGKRLKYIAVPSVVPHFRAACTSALGFGWKSGVAAEVLTVPRDSVGRMIYESKLYLQTTDLFAWTAAVILISLCLERIVMRLAAGRGKNA